MKIGKENLVMQLQLHNEKALEFLVMEHGERLTSIIRKHLFTLPHLQQECLIDTVQSIWNYADCFDESNEFENWIGSVARFRCLEFLRKHQKEATIAWLIEKEIAEEKEMMISCLEDWEQELFHHFYVGDFPQKKSKEDRYYRNMYELLNRIDTDIFEYEKEPLTLKEKEEVLRQLQFRSREKKKHRFSLKKYFGHFFRKPVAVNYP